MFDDLGTNETLSKSPISLSLWITQSVIEVIILSLMVCSNFAYALDLCIRRSATEQSPLLGVSYSIMTLLLNILTKDLLQPNERR